MNTTIFSLLENHKDKLSILQSIEELKIVLSLLGYANIYYDERYGTNGFTQYFLFKNKSDYVKISFVKTIDENIILQIKYPVSTLEKNRDFYGLVENVHDEEKFLKTINNIVCMI